MSIDEIMEVIMEWIRQWKELSATYRWVQVAMFNLVLRRPLLSSFLVVALGSGLLCKRGVLQTNLQSADIFLVVAFRGREAMTGNMSALRRLSPDWCFLEILTP